MLFFQTLAVLLTFPMLSSALTTKELTLFDDDVKITDEGLFHVIRSSGLPEHSTEKVNPNDATAQNYEIYIPIIPSPLRTGSGCLPMGIIGLARNGVALFNPYTADGYNAIEGARPEEFDPCKGHPTDRGTYHYHQSPLCLFSNDPLSSFEVDQFVGVGLDGYPIYGPLTIEGSSEKLLTHSDLDECNGRTVNGQYRYHLTADFPYVLGCFKGYSVPVGGGPGPRRRRQSGPQCFYANVAQPAGFSNLQVATLNNGEDHNLTPSSASRPIYLQTVFTLLTTAIVFQVLGG